MPPPRVIRGWAGTYPTQAEAGQPRFETLFCKFVNKNNEMGCVNGILKSGSESVRLASGCEGAGRPSRANGAARDT